MYYINGQQCQQNDVATLLKSHGVDLDHKRFLILQGEVELISLMKPKAANENEEGLLEYLEDIIGTSHFAESIEECARSADIVNADYCEKMLRTRHCEKELELLVEEKERAESFLKLENSITEKKSELFQVFKYQNEAKLAKSKESLLTVSNSLAKEQEKNAHQVFVVEQLESELKQKSSTHSALERKVAELQKNMKRLENEDVALREKKSFLKKKLLSMGKSSTESDKRRGEAERERGNLQIERDRLEKQIVDLEKSIESNQKDLHNISASLKDKTGDLQAELTKKQLELQPWQEQVRKAQANYEIALSSMNDLNKRRAADGEDSERIAASIELSEKELANAQESKKTLLLQQKDLQKQSAKLVEHRQMAEIKLEQTAKDILLLQSTVGEAKEAFAQQSRTVSGNSTVNALMRDAKKITGNIYGRLGDLGVIDGKYDVAVSTASSQLHFVVVDSTETAQRCVDYLRKNNLGRASFIILEKMRPVNNNNVDVKYPAGVERLFDLVTPKDRLFLPAFYFALGETLVADNMDIASRVAYDGPKRNRVVTLDGKLIDTSGTMSGGGKQLQRGAMRLKRSTTHNLSDEKAINEEQIMELQSLLSERQEEQKILKAMIADFSQNIASASKELRQVELELAKAEQVICSLPSQIKELQVQQKKGGKVGIKYDSSHIEQSLSIAEQELKKAEADMAPIAKQIALVEDKIMDAGGVKYKVQKAKLEGLQEQLSLAQSRLSKVAANISVLEATLDTSKHIHGDNKSKGEQGLVEAEIVKLDEQLEAFTLQAIDLKSQIDQSTTSINEHKEVFDDVKRSLEQHNRALSKFKKHEFELKVKAEELEKECAECEDNIQKYSQALALLQLNELSNHELAELDQDELKGRSKRDIESLQHEIATLESRLANIPNPNIAVLKEYSRQKAVVDELSSQLREVEQQKHCIQSQLEQLRQDRMNQFMAGLRQISLHLKQLYQLLTMGGNAELELVDSLDPFSEGVMFSVMPPRKSWKAISNLSGGEKTLASLSLIFALHSFRPTPIYVMDEIDAALDFRNVSVVANYIKQRTFGAQFIVISLRNDMFELADRLVGVYKVNQQTKSVSIDPLQFAPLLSQQ